MKKLLLILLCLPMIGLGQQTYVPDDVFEEYIELNFPLADNGISNDDYVLTAGVVFSGSTGLLYLGNTPSTSSIQDLTGIEDFSNVSILSISNLNITTIDLSQITLLSSGHISINSCPLVTDIILPSDSFSLTLGTNTYLTNIVFNPSIFIHNLGYGLAISGCNSLTSIDMSNILGVSNGATLQFAQNLNLTQVNLKNGFCYNWGSVNFTFNPNLFCIQVDDPNYSSISGNWSWFVQIPNTTNSYSTNCGWPSALQEHTTNKEILKVTDLLGKETPYRRNTPLFHIYDDVTVEKKIIIE